MASNSDDEEKSKLEAEKKKLDAEKEKLEEDKQKDENEKIKSENEKLKNENQKLKKQKKFKTNEDEYNDNSNVSIELYNVLGDTIKSYVSAFADDVNYGSMSDSTQYYDKDGALFKEQQRVIPSLHNQGISEDVNNVIIKNVIEFKPHQYSVEALEDITIKTKSGESKTKNYDNIYIVVYLDGKYQIRQLNPEKLFKD